MGDIQYGEYVRKKSPVKRRCQNIGPAVDDQKSAIPEAMTLLPCIDSKSNPPPGWLIYLIWTIASGLAKVRVGLVGVVDSTEYGIVASTVTSRHGEAQAGHRCTILPATSNRNRSISVKIKFPVDISRARQNRRSFGTCG